MLSRMFIDAPEDLVSSTCILPISIDLFYDETDGKERLQEGENLAATVHMLNQLGLKDCVIVISDLLQRHNATIDNNETVGGAAEEQARQAGARWRARNDHIIARLAMPYKILYWHELNQHANYSSKRESIQLMYDEKPDAGRQQLRLKRLVSEVARNFVNGFGRGHPKGHPDELVDFDLRVAVELSIEYLLEELAVISLWRDGLCQDLVGDNEKIFMMYPFGKSTPSRDVYACIEYICHKSGNLQLKDIKKGGPVSTKVLSQHKQEKKPGATRKDRKKGREEPTTKPALTDDAFSAEQADESSTQIGNLILGTLTLKFSRGDIRHQMAAFHGAVSYVNKQLELQEKAQQKLSDPREASGAVSPASSPSLFALTYGANLGQKSLEEGHASSDIIAAGQSFPAAKAVVKRSLSSPGLSNTYPITANLTKNSLLFTHPAVGEQNSRAAARNLLPNS
ncbi:MAG: hypothetical protein KBD83_07110 [Gammaproteobacteria bacterium]|nr:hypothetical protein [Gammaproteobacteria bacterium]